MNYPFAEIEEKWDRAWEEKGLNRAPQQPHKKFYCLDMFPYPSGDGLHVGHWRGYVLSDVWARYKRMQGHDVLHPIGFDAFGLPAENTAIKQHTHPQEYTNAAIATLRRQLKEIGAAYDWEREINTATPQYYKWTQWLFLQLFKKGLAYQKEGLVNWCPQDQTVLANEQVIDGCCERCGTRVVHKSLKQWYFKITKYTERLLGGLDKLDWPERTKTLQRNWIGKSQGVLIKFQIENSPPKANPPRADKIQIETFTTRPETIYGATFLVLAPEHPLLSKIVTIQQKQAVESYIHASKARSELARQSEKPKTGAFTGIYVNHPLTNKQLPVWMSDYVLMGYGTGAIMAVPAHDERDKIFAEEHDLAIISVIGENGRLKNSAEFNDSAREEGQKRIVDALIKKRAGRLKVSYRLRDWLISRQRYWGAPIPLVFCKHCAEIVTSNKRQATSKYNVGELQNPGWISVPQDQLPVTLPKDIEFKPTGESPLKQSKDFVETVCPQCGKPAKRETDTMDTFVDSSWYFLRYINPQKKDAPFDQEDTRHWLPVDLYIGGVEHATLHLMYARFITKVLHDLKHISFTEPFWRLFNIGLITSEGAKMSKSKGNVVSPDELVAHYGRDALRGYELFIGPADEDAVWQPRGLVGVARFLQKVWELLSRTVESDGELLPETIQLSNDVPTLIEDFRLNSLVAYYMSYLNKLERAQTVSKKDFAVFVQLLAPVFPYLAEELWQRLGNKESVFISRWPTAKDREQKICTIVVQVNGKVRSTLTVKLTESETNVVKKAKTLPRLIPFLTEKKIKKTIYVHGRALNFVLE